MKQFTILEPKDVIKKLYLKQKILDTEFINFKIIIEEFKNSTKHSESEEYNKNLITDFLNKIGYAKEHKINTAGRVDLAIYKDNIPEVLIESKSPKNKIEMITPENINKKAFQESILYYLREKIKEENYNIRNIIITNNIEWFVFDAQEINKIATNKKIEKLYREFEIDKTSSIKKTDEFYKFLENVFNNNPEILLNLKFTYFSLNDNISDTKLQHIYKLFSPEHLLKTFKINDANTLNKNFYYELLHILGLEETKDGSKKVIGRKIKSNREDGSLLENTILKLQTEHDIEDEEKLFEIALELNISWLNRILFLKLLEARLSNIHSTNYPKFLSYDITSDFDKLNTLFFEVLAKTIDKRNSVKIPQYQNIPYLNSSLFEPTELERKYLRISNLKDNLTLKKLQRTVLKDEKIELNSIEYLLKFLNSYDFGSNTKDEFKNEHSTIINSAVLGLIFEKLNGYKDGSFFTPAFVTMYMTKESITKSVVDKFNEKFSWNCKTIEDIHYKDYDVKEANELINSITICDPAVGSGHFLVSSLNELLYIKSELGILVDTDGKRLKNVKLELEDDEIYIVDEDGEIVEYKLNENNKISENVKRIQKAIFDEKLHIIENQLFGVDINPNSVKITRLRLWVELLKDSYYDDNNELVTLPNIDINIKCGNSLISKFPLNDSDTKNKLLKDKLNDYKNHVKRYKEISDKSIKKDIVEKIENIKQSFTQKLKDGSPQLVELKRLLNGHINTKNEIKKGYIEQYGFKGLIEDIISKFADKQYFLMYSRFGKDFDPISDTSLFANEIILTVKEKKIQKELQEKELKKILEKYEIVKEFEDSEIYTNSFEWRFEFPEVLNDEGDFVGFDIVIGNPPYLSNKDIPINDKKAYDKIFNLSDDLYNYFFIKSFQLLKEDGLLNLITSNTFMTINSKINVRHLLQSKKIIEFMPIKNPFEEASVEPIIVFAQNTNTNKDYIFDYVDLRKQDFNPIENRYKINIDIYKNTPNQVFFTPTEQNKKIHTKYISKVNDLLDLYWDKISTSSNIAKNENELNIYRDNLKVGDITLLGLVTDGGQGLSTANNSKYLAVQEGTKEAIRIKQTRVEKLELFNKKHNQTYTINDLSEFEIRELFDNLKEELGQDIFGQGYLFKIVSQDEIADVDTLTDEEKANGIDSLKSFVPYDKGDRDGNKWYYETPFYINWNVENVRYLKDNNGKKGHGVVRNPQFYFKDGFSWNLINGDKNFNSLKTKYINKSINDAGGTKLISFNKNISVKYIILIMNSVFSNKYTESFINSSLNFTINSAKEIPIIVPTEEQLKEFEDTFDIAKEIKIKEFSNQITKDEAKQQLQDIQNSVDSMVYELYGLSDDENKIVEGV